MSILAKWPFIKEQVKYDKFAGLANQIPGEVFHVVPGASATHLSWTQRMHKNVFTTIDLAYAQVISGRGDAIVLHSGTHTPTASIALAKNDLSIFGWEAWMGQRVQKPSALIVAPSADEAFNITGANAKFLGVQCRPVTTKSFADFTAGAAGLTIRHCFIDLFTPVVNIATAGFVGSAAILDFLFERNIAWSDGAQGPAVELTGANLRGLFEENLFHVDAGTWASAVNLIAPDGITVRRNRAQCGGTAMTACFTGSSTTVIAGVSFEDNRSGVLVTKFVDGFATTTHAEMVENRIATIGGGTGSTLIVDIT